MLIIENQLDSKLKLMNKQQNQKTIDSMKNCIEQLQRSLKNKDNQLKYYQEYIVGLKQENKILGNFIETMKKKWEQNSNTSQQQQNLYKLSYDEYSQKLGKNCDQNALRALAQQINEQLENKNDEICVLKAQNFMLTHKIQRLQAQIMNKNNNTLGNLTCIEKSNIKQQKNHKLQCRKGLTFRQLQSNRKIKNNQQNSIQNFNHRSHSRNKKFLSPDPIINNYSNRPNSYRAIQR